MLNNCELTYKEKLSLLINKYNGSVALLYMDLHLNKEGPTILPTTSIDRFDLWLNSYVEPNSVNSRAIDFLYNKLCI